MKIRSLVLTASIPIGLLAATSCGSSGPESVADLESVANLESVPELTGETAADSMSETHQVTIARSRFDNLELTIGVGETVTFINTDEFDHTVTSSEAPVAFDSGILGQDEVFELRFTEPGTYSYYCAIHPTMRATVVVER